MDRYSFGQSHYSSSSSSSSSIPYSFSYQSDSSRDKRSGSSYQDDSRRGDSYRRSESGLGGSSSSSSSGYTSRRDDWRDRPPPPLDRRDVDRRDEKRVLDHGSSFGRDDRIKRSREESYPKEALEINMQLQLTIKSLKEELNKYKDETEYLKRRVDETQAENFKLKREVSALEEDLDAKRAQIKSERIEREKVFKDNDALITKLEDEVYRLRAHQVLPSLPPILTHSLVSPSVGPSTLLTPSMSTTRLPANTVDSLPTKVKEGIALHSERCVWLSESSVPPEELAKSLGGKENVDSIFVNPRNSAAFILFRSAEQAVDGLSIARSLYCTHSGVKCNSVNNTIWIGNLYVDEATLYALCGLCGEVDNVRVMHTTHCAFVTFKDTISAVTACCDLDGLLVGTSRLTVNFKFLPKYAVERHYTLPSLPVCNSLYVGDLDYSTTREDLISIFGTYGNVMKVRVANGGDYAFVTFENLEEAVIAKFHLQGKKFGAKSLTINFSKYSTDPKEAQVSENLSIKASPYVSEDKLSTLLGKYGKVSALVRQKGGEEWHASMATPEEAIIVKAHLHKRTVSGAHFDIDYIPKSHSPIRSSTPTKSIASPAANIPTPIPAPAITIPPAISPTNIKIEPKIEEVART